MKKMMLAAGLLLAASAAGAAPVDDAEDTEGMEMTVPIAALPFRIILTSDLDQQGRTTNCVARIVAPPGVDLSPLGQNPSCADTGFDLGVHLIDADGRPAKGRVQMNIEMKSLPAAGK